MASKTMPYIPNSVTKTLICVNAATKSDYSGMIYNHFMPEPKQFNSYMELINIMEDFFDAINFPQPNFRYRSFFPPRQEQGEENESLQAVKYFNDDLFEMHHGKIATFILEVKYRQNATWQGEFIWKEHGQSAAFRSLLEFTKLSNAILLEVLANLKK